MPGAILNILHVKFDSDNILVTKNDSPELVKTTIKKMHAVLLFRFSAEFS